MNESKPYVYKIIYDTGHYYYGYREANIVPAHLDIGSKYFTSSSKIHEMGFENTKIEIIKEFTEEDITSITDTPGDAAFDYEQATIFEHFDDPLCLNENVRLPDGSKRFKSKRGEENFNYGKTYEQIHGVEKGKELREKRSTYMSENNPFKGRKHTEESNRKNSESHKGTLVDLYGEEKAKEMIANQIAAQTGKKHDSEWCNNISNGLKGKPKSESHRLSLKGCQLGRKDSEETKKRKSDSRKGKKLSAETIEKIRLSKLGVTRGPNKKKA